MAGAPRRGALCPAQLAESAINGRCPGRAAGLWSIVAFSREKSVVIIGSGVIGLTTAVCLAEAGLPVHVVADRPAAQTTSAMAGAMWGPFASPDPRVSGWSLDSLADLLGASEDKSSGVRITRGVEAARTAVSPPGWLERALDFALCSPAEIPAGYVSGWSYSAPLFDMPVYLGYLWDRAAGAGATIQILDAPVRALRELAARSPVIINCTGLGSRALVPDPGLSAAWGQLVVVENPGVEGFFTDYPEIMEPTYFIAHEDHVILGGRVVHERMDLAPDNAIADRILDRCYAAEPRLAGSRVISFRTGLRPVRATVRLEREEQDGMLIIHNYGHGGSGVTLSWGCAREVLSLL